MTKVLQYVDPRMLGRRGVSDSSLLIQDCPIARSELANRMLQRKIRRLRLS